MDKLGNIRSVNVDYSEITERISRREAAETRSATSYSLASNIQSKRSSSLGSDKTSQFAPLDSAILASLRELSKCKQKNTIHVSQLIEHLDAKYEHHIDLPAIKFIDCALNGLLRSGGLTLESLDHDKMATLLLSANERARQSVFVDQLLVVPSAKNQDSDALKQTSRSTTLDSGIRSWDLSTGRATRISPHSSPVSHTISLVNRQNKAGFSLWRSFSFKGKQRPLLIERWQESSPERKFQDLRIKHENIHNIQEKATKPSGLFRSKSVRCIRNTTSMRSPDHEIQMKRHYPLEKISNQSATIDYLSSSACKRGGSIFTRTSGEPIRSKGIVLFLRKLFVTGKSTNKSSRNKIDRKTQSENFGGARNRRSTTVNENLPKVISERPCKDAQPVQSGVDQSLSESPLSSSDNSSGLNSLIEILDCSPALNSSRRPLREETVCTNGNLNRATKRTLVKRSGSSLSQNSQISSSTTRSNVSQQLRRHLDEVYKRHQNCTSQRERDFIDSINVLRQASRHVIQQSVRGRQISPQTRSKSSAIKPETQSNSVKPNCSSNRSNNNNHQTNTQRNYQVPSKEIDLTVREQANYELLNCREITDFDANGNVSTSTAAMESSLSNCCLCNSYLTSAKLCPLLSCSTSGACCLLAQQQLQLRPPETLKMAAQLPEFCCPLWRSLLYGYSQPFWPNPSFPIPNHQSSLETVEHLVASQQQLLQQQQQQLHQHQHNTTIDLKIEIGSDFLKEKEEAGNEMKTVSEPDDSLVSDQTSDDSLSKLASGHSEQNSDSLQADVLSTTGD